MQLKKGAKARNIALPDGMSPSDFRWALTGILTVFFAAMVSMNVVVTALPVIVGELDGSQIQYSWVVTATLLANASSTPIWGKLADMMSKKTLFQVSNLIFLFSSLLAGFAPSMEMLIGARFIQGIGLGGLTALAMAILGSIVSPRDRGRYSGYIGAVMATATALGPLVGGLTVDTLGWRWCFFVGVPLSVFALVLITFKLRVPVHRSGGGVDYAGALVLVLCSSLVLAWLSFAGTPEFFAWVSWPSAVLVLSAVVLLALFILIEQRVPHPIIHLRMLIQRTTFLAVIASASIAVCLFGMPAYLGQYFQMGRGLSPTESGMMILPLVFGNLLSSTIAGRLVSRFGVVKPFLVIGSVVLSIGMFGLSRIDHLTPYPVVMVLLFVVGLGLGAQMQNLVLIVQNTVSVTAVGQAGSLVSFFRTFGGAAGTSILGSVMAVQLGAGASGASAGAGTMSPAYADASGTMFLVAACLTLPAILTNLLIRETPLRSTI